MRLLRTAWFPAFLSILLIPGCTSSTELTREIHDPYVEFSRAEFAAMYPESPHVEAVRKGTVVAGMDTTAVVAAWGAPQVRDEREPESTEWVYFEIDPDSGDPVDYALQFNAGRVTAWDVRVHEALSGSDVVFEAWLARSAREHRMKDYQYNKSNQAVPFKQHPRVQQTKKE